MVSEEQNSEIELASEVIPVPQVPPEVEVQAPTPKAMDDPNGKQDCIPHGKTRHRKKALYAAILKQMEFYFGDSNLSKDRFLAGQIKECPDVPLDTFLKFNRIRSLTTDIEKLAKALSKSTILHVSEDGKTVRRTTPILEKNNVDECTIYVQRLPSDADHDWLSTLFSEYGPVAYVSIPKFKSNQKIKGFAFIEFETDESAKKCLKAFRAKGCELPSQTSPTEVMSITTFTEEEKEEKNGNEDSENVEIINRKQKHEKSLEEDEPKAKKLRESLKNDEGNECDNNDKESNIDVSDSNIQKEEKRGKKRKNRPSLEEVQSPEADTQNIPHENDKTKKMEEIEAEVETDNSSANESIKDTKKRKKLKTEKESEPEYSVKSETDKESNKKKKKLKTDNSKIETNSENIDMNEDVDEENEEAAESANDETAPEKKKKKKRKRKHHAPYELLQTVDMGLQVMGKKDWKKLRNKYLELQRAKMKQLKQNIRRARWNQWGDRNKIESEQEDTTGTKKDNSTNSKKENPASVLKFIPNVIVKIELNEPCLDTKSFKVELKSHSSNIKYIDVKEGAHEAYVRCDSSDAASTLAQKSNEEKHLRVLTGDEELYYWDKITRDREEKIGNKIRVNQRGRNKLLKKAEKELGKHIKFDEV